KSAIKVSKGDIVVFMDVDLSTSLNNLPKLINSIHRGYDIAIGSRYKEGSRVKRPITRTIASRTYNLLVNLLFKDGILDHQCGFKAFKRQSIEPLIEAVKSKGFFFDTELILKAMRRGLSIVEIPIEWKETRKEPALRKIIAMAPEMLWELLALKLSGEVEGRFEG
ncbi:MAG: glycosyltransferase, partial [Candidatus Bathyarchaeia archaeon]